MKRSAFALAAVVLLLALAGLVYLVVTPASAPRAADAGPRAAAPAPPDAGAAPPEAPPPASAAARPVDAPRSLFGVVTNRAGEPIAGATVRLVAEKTPDRIVRTAADGRFTVDRLPARATRLEVSARGYTPRAFDRPAFPAAPRARWDVVLDPAAGVHGVVLANGEPAAGARVLVFPRDGVRVPPLAAAVSDGSGRFALDPQRPGPYRLTAVHGQHGTAAQEVAGPGEVTLHLPGGGFIEGRVVDPEGDPVQSFTVSASALARGHGGPPAQSFESGDGAFRLGPVAPGVHVVWAVAEGYQPGERKRVQVMPGETSGGVVLKLQRSATLTGRVTDAVTRRPIAGAWVVPAEWDSGALAESVGAMTDADGRYTLRALPGLRTSIDVRADGYRPLLGGGVQGAPGGTVVRDFSLSPQPRDEVPASELTGIGAVLGPHPSGVRLQSIIEGGPASAALNEGDVVVMVGGEKIGPRDMGKAAQAIRGEIGTDVELWVLRDGQGEPERVVLRRDRVVLPEPHHPRPRRDGDDTN
jgi:hypothetical protein